jgi:hypothetical protein
VRPQDTQKNIEESLKEESYERIFFYLAFIFTSNLCTLTPCNKFLESYLFKMHIKHLVHSNCSFFQIRQFQLKTRINQQLVLSTVVFATYPVKEKRIIIFTLILFILMKLQRNGPNATSA